MAGRYVGFFNSLDGVHYKVQFDKSGSTGDYEEILLAGEEPFIVNYETSNTPFDSVRTSTATINVVHNSYMQDIMSPYAMGTSVKLIQSGSTEKIVWQGYLKPTLFDASYENEYETFEIVANDYLLTLQYLNYTDDSAYTKSVVTVSSILGRICDDLGLSDGFYWTNTKKVGNNNLLPTSLKISEQNFFSSDTDEPWKMDEVLDEICKYFGFTAVQWENGLYLIDYMNFHSSTSIQFYHFTSPYSSGSISIQNRKKKITQSNIRGNNGNVTFEPIYNKCKVNSNFYEIESFIPDLFNDDLLTNRIDSGNFYTNYEVLPEVPSSPSYPWGTKWLGGQQYKNEAVADDTYRYFHRLYDHKNYESLYYSVMTSPSNPQRFYPSAAIYATSAVTRDYAGGTIVDLGVVKKKYYDSELGEYVVPNKLDYTRYLCISQKGIGLNWRQGSINLPVIKLKDYSSIAPFSDSSFLVINYTLLFEKYLQRAYINPEWTTDTLEAGLVDSQKELQSIDGMLYFKLKIGDKYWNGSNWTTTLSTFYVPVEHSANGAGYINEERKTLNNISWDEFVNEEGYKIPLSGIDTCSAIEFEILFPNLQFYLNKDVQSEWDSKKWNAYCWVKDFSIKCVEKGQDAEKEESDVIYENVIDTDAVNELDEITLKLTTSTELTKPSYSNVIYNDGTRNTMLSGVLESNITNVAQKPEQNIVQKYVDYYSSSTKKIELTIDNNYTPVDVFYNVDTEDLNKNYVMMGCEIDYSQGAQKITMIQVK